MAIDLVKNKILPLYALIAVHQVIQCMVYLIPGDVYSLWGKMETQGSFHLPNVSLTAAKERWRIL